MTKYYRVEQSEAGCPRSVLCGATSRVNATARLASIVENMEANSWTHTDEVNIKKLATVVMLTDGSRVVTLSVMECTAEDVTGTKLELRDMPWLVRSVALSGIEADNDYSLNADKSPTEDDLFEARLGSDTVEQEVGV